MQLYSLQHGKKLYPGSLPCCIRNACSLLKQSPDLEVLKIVKIRPGEEAFIIGEVTQAGFQPCTPPYFRPSKNSIRKMLK